MTKTRYLGVCLAVLVTGAIACRAAGRGEAPLTPAVDAWLHCEECVDGEREAVRARGTGVVAELRRALLSGPTAAQRDAARREYEIAYRSLGDAASSGRDEYVRVLLENYVATFQKRAAIALSDIGGSQARDALREALEPGRISRYREDVQTMIRIADASLSDRWLGGTVTPPAPGFGDTVVLRPVAGRNFTGFEMVNLQGALYPDSAVRAAVTPGELRFVVTAPEGQRLLTVHGGAGQDTGHTTLIVRTLADANDRLLSHCADVFCMRDAAPRLLSDSGSVSQFLALWRRPTGSDTLDVFRFQASRALRVTAVVDWRPAGEVELRWRPCSDGTVTVDTAWAPRGRWRASRIVLNGGACALLEVVLTSRQEGIVAARLQVLATRLSGGSPEPVVPPTLPEEVEPRDGTRRDDVWVDTLPPPPPPAPPPNTGTSPPPADPQPPGSLIGDALDRVKKMDTAIRVRPVTPVIK